MRPALAACFLAVALVAFVPAVALAQDGGFAVVPATLPFDETRYLAIAPGDMDGDGDLDLLVAYGDTPIGGLPTLYHVELYRNDGINALGRLALARVPFPVAPFDPPLFGRPPSVSLSWADVDGDGDVDAFVGTHWASSVFRNDGGTFDETSPVLRFLEFRGDHRGMAKRSSAWADLDNDGDVDLATTATFGSPYAWYTADTTRVVIYHNDGGTLSLADSTRFPVLRPTDIGLAWGDLELDGDLDLLAIDRGAACDHHIGSLAGECLVLYRNDDGTLTDLGLDFPEVQYADADFGDYDSDGDLDILLVGHMFNNEPPYYFYDRAIIYRNDGSAFTPDTLAFPFAYDEYYFDLDQGRWADYDGDGDVDILIGGTVDDYGGPGQDFGSVAFVFSNEGGTFTLRAALDAPTYFGATAWADMDSDGDLDLMVVGSRFNRPGQGMDMITRLYRNDSLTPNAPPSPPGGLTATVTAPDAVTLSWAPGTDDHTPPEALTYSLRVATVDGQDIVSPHARPGGGRLVAEPGNVSLNRTWTLRALAPGTYTWAVQSVDNAFNGGGFAEGGTFTVGVVATDAGTPGQAVLLLAPNPTAGAARASLTLPIAAHATVEVVDALGRRVATLANEPLGAGAHAWSLEAERLTAGVYTVRARLVPAGGEASVLVGRLVVIR